MNTPEPEATMRVQAHLPAKLWWHLTKVAERRNTTVGAIVTECVRRSFAEQPATVAPPAPAAAPVVAAPVPRERWAVRQVADGWVALPPGLGDGIPFPTQLLAFAHVKSVLAPPPVAKSLAHAAETPTKRTYVRWSDIYDKEMRRLHAEGLTDTAIARELGVSNANVGMKRMAAGLPKNAARQAKRESA